MIGRGSVSRDNRLDNDQIKSLTTTIVDKISSKEAPTNISLRNSNQGRGF